MKEFPTQQVLELACAAQRINGAYIKESNTVFADDGVAVYTQYPNKIMMLYTLDPAMWTASPALAPMLLKVLSEDITLAEEIKKHFRKFMFGAIEGENDFQTNINTILESETTKQNQFGYVACLPSVYVRDIAQTKVKRASRVVEDGFLSEIGSVVKDLDAEIISSIKSKNFEGYNIDAIISNKMVSWMNKTDLSPGPAVLVKAKVKDHSKHWKHQNDVTRLHYVKVAQ